MESQRINILLQKYFEAETTLAEENELINYFNSGKVDEELKSYIPVFSGLKEALLIEKPTLSDDLMNYIMKSEQKEKVRSLWKWQIVTAVAASVITVMLAVNIYSDQKTWKDTYSDPDKAYAEARKTLDYVAGKYNKGIIRLKPIETLENTLAPLNSGMKLLNKGIKKFEDIDQNKKL